MTVVALANQPQFANAKAKEEQALYILEAASGMRISEALALEVKHFMNEGRTIFVEQLAEDGLGWHGFRRFRNTWLKKQRVQEDLRKFWMAHKPEEMEEVYCALKEDLPARLAEAERVGYGFVLPEEFVPNVPRKNHRRDNRKARATGILVNKMKETRGV